MKPNIKLFISSEKIPGAFGRGKYLLLDAIRREGSLQKAAASLGRSYRKAWGDIRRAEEGFGRRLVVCERGGVGGGKTELTEFGLELLKAWETFEKVILKSVQTAFEKHVKGILEEHSC